MSDAVIFLDIDGVLNNFASIERYEDTLDPDCVAVLNGIIAASQAEVVISSTWRLHYPLAPSR